MTLFTQKPRKEDLLLDTYLYEDEGYWGVGYEEQDDDLDPPQRQMEIISPNAHEDDVSMFVMLICNIPCVVLVLISFSLLSLGSKSKHQPSHPTNQTSPCIRQHSLSTSRPYKRQTSCDHDDLLRQLLQHVQKLLSQYEELNKKVDNIMEWTRPRLHLETDYTKVYIGTEGDDRGKVGTKMEVQSEQLMCR
ncbi:hypothetical protein Fot_11232 [Forsythia ovata]|uniref:Uncharacterized protein n=1 Tax=Forsythia ovata TaxID=205694 RepID=A0ABD1WJ20_9LAMI